MPQLSYPNYAINRHLTGNLIASDADHATNTLTWSISNGAGSYGTLTIAADGSFVYSPNAAAINALAFGQNPVDQFIATVTDPNGAFNNKEIRIQLVGVDDFIDAPPPIDPTDPTDPINPGLGEEANRSDITPEIFFFNEEIKEINQSLETIKASDIQKISIDDTVNSNIGIASMASQQTEIAPTNNKLTHAIFNVAYENISYQLAKINYTASGLEATQVNFQQVQLNHDNTQFRMVSNSSHVVKVTGVAVTASAVWWALRATGLLASVMTSLPAWRQVDLLSLLPEDGSLTPEDADDFPNIENNGLF